MKIVQFQQKDFVWRDWFSKVISNYKTNVPILEMPAILKRLSDLAHLQTWPRFCTKNTMCKLFLKSIIAYIHNLGVSSQTKTFSLSLSNRIQFKQYKHRMDCNMTMTSDHPQVMVTQSIRNAVIGNASHDCYRSLQVSIDCIHHRAVQKRVLLFCIVEFIHTKPTTRLTELL